ncbi:hypothetical protein E3P98_02398 [Wallemia ichthyophaga]|nr:hypothetical protein E3P98_02398 [Wallemia ichthyophaga]
MADTRLCVSAPGKVLIAGGYLILSKEYSGVVLSTEARFYTYIESCDDEDIKVISPQFGSEWIYDSNIKQINTEQQNDFVQLALEEVSKYIEYKHDSSMKGLRIVIAADNDFYSQRAYLRSKQLDATYRNLQAVPKLNKDLKNINKTGLGSSAALITSLVGSLLLRYNSVSKEFTDNDKQLVHNLAQYIHCRAQGKVGSGFDVSAAVFGSHTYSRFDPATINDLIDQYTSGEMIDSIVNKGWDSLVDKIALPYGVSMHLADIEYGSHTPSLVKKVNEWKSKNLDQANELYKSLDISNKQLAGLLVALNKSYETNQDGYLHALDYLSNLIPSEWLKDESNSVVNQFVDLKLTLQNIRATFRTLSAKADVPIEPVKQTRLLEACSEIKGVIGGGVPGAGGYDAIYLLAISSTQTANEIESKWLKWDELSVSPLVCGEGFQGIKNEDAFDISRLLGT